MAAYVFRLCAIRYADDFRIKRDREYKIQEINLCVAGIINIIYRVFHDQDFSLSTGLF